MTRLAILADIHGNLPALEAVLQDLSQFKMDHVIVAGDRSVNFDDEPLYREFERQGFLEECGVSGRPVIEEFKTARLRVSPFNCWRNACRPGEPFSMKLLDEFSKINQWDYTPLVYHVNL